MIYWPISDKEKRFIAISRSVLSCLCELYREFGAQYNALHVITFETMVSRGLLLGAALRRALDDGVITKEEYDITARAYEAL